MARFLMLVLALAASTALLLKTWNCPEPAVPAPSASACDSFLQTIAVGSDVGHGPSRPQ